MAGLPAGGLEFMAMRARYLRDKRHRRPLTMMAFNDPASRCPAE
jgi:hypothetical protein